MFIFVSLVAFVIEHEAFYSCILQSSFALEDVSFILFGQHELIIAFIKYAFCYVFAFIMSFLCLGFEVMVRLLAFNAIFNKSLFSFLLLNGLSLLMISELLVKLV